MYDILIVTVCVFVIAFLYSSIGHGGASGYLALMVLFGFEPQLLRSSALFLNILVSALAFYQYYRKKHFKWRLFFPFAITSLPAAFVGGLVFVDSSIYKKILAICLLIAVLRLMFIQDIQNDLTKKIPLSWALLIGAGIGFLSGIIGIGGGIILTPILILLHWARMKEAAAVSALFIFVNSISGTLGLMQGGLHFHPNLIYWIFAAFLGGIFGSFFGSTRFSGKILRYILAFVLFFASIKLLI